jgi:hypothetical protein
MAMHNTNSSFYGQQTGEKILYVVRPHPISINIRMFLLYLISIGVLIIFHTFGKLIEPIQGTLTIIGFIIAAFISFVGTYILKNSQGRNITYITDRRIVRFEPTTVFATNIRTLSWDEVVKVKTYVPNMIWKQLAIGNISIHARSTTSVINDADPVLSVDDIEIKDVYYYRDLCNYIDKILYTYKQKPREMDEIRPFVVRPKGQRY